MLAEHGIGFADQIINVAKNLQGGILREVFLQVAVTAIHRTVARKIDDEIVTANLTVAAGAFFEKLAAMTHEGKTFLACSKRFARAPKRALEAFQVDYFECCGRQRATQIV